MAFQKGNQLWKLSSGMRGKHHTKEAKEKIGLKHKGKKLSEIHKENIGLGLKGKPRPDMNGDKNPMRNPKIAKKFGLTQRGKVCLYMRGDKSPSKRPEVKKKLSILRSGEGNPNWQGGINSEPYTPDFNKQLKEIIRERDGHICQRCDIPENGQRLCVHHIDYNKKNSVPTNLISLCNNCNLKVNFNREYWTLFFQNIINGGDGVVQIRKSLREKAPESEVFGVEEALAKID